MLVVQVLQTTVQPKLPICVILQENALRMMRKAHALPVDAQCRVIPHSWGKELLAQASVGSVRAL